MSENNQNRDTLNRIFEELNRLARSNKPDDLSRRIELCQQALEIIPKEKYPGPWAKLQDDLATSLMLTPIGDRAKNIEQAIHHFQQALEVRTRNADAERWAMTQFNLAGAYYKRICDERSKNLEQAIWHCEQALEVYSRKDFPHEWAQAKNTLGEVYRVRIRGSRRENLEESIHQFQEALEVHKRETFPVDWAMVQNNLAAVYSDRILGERTKNIEESIQHAKQALEIRTRASDAERWAMTQHNLGHAYRYRIRGDLGENFEQAIHYFEQALEVRTRQDFPKDWAETQNNLGDTYLGRIRGEPEKNIEKAIDYFQQALDVYSYETFPEYWAQVQSNLGNAYLASAGDRAENIEKAIHHYEQALKVRIQEVFPEDWAQTHNNLAGAYTQRLRGEPADNIEQAIQHLKQALQVYTQESFPQDWAGARNNLAIAYTNRIRGEKTENTEQAIHHYQRALEVYTRQSFPDLCVKASRALGNLAFEGQRWELARETYDKAFGAQELLMQASFSRAGKQTELREVQNLPARAAYAHVKLGDPQRAVEVLEQGRAQLLRESLERQRQDLKQLPALEFGNLYENYVQATEQYDALQSIGTSENARLGDWMGQMEQALEKVQAATVAIREEAGRKHPQYRYFLQALPYPEIQKQAWEKPLVYLSATSAGGLALVVTRQGVQVIELPELNQESLQKQIWSPSEKEIDRINDNLKERNITPEDIQAVKGGYFSMYALWSLTPYLTRISEALKDKLFEDWKETLDNTTRWLWNVVMSELISVLKENQNESATLIPAGHLALLPLHAAWKEDTSQPAHRQYALDEINIIYAPSAHALWQASLAAERPTESLMVVDNPDGSLRAAKDEVSTALHLFQKTTHLPGKKATVKAVKEKMQEANVLHFATHGKAGWQEEEQAQLKLADGYLTLPDIFELRLRQARLAVLSACETGVPILKLIDEMIGLPAGMMQAGVPGVVGSLWSVNDMSTALLMQRFYKFWREDGRAPQEALRQAQIWLRDSLFRSPYYWAAFTYTGV